jgi:hypothetical protein
MAVDVYPEGIHGDFVSEWAIVGQKTSKVIAISDYAILLDDQWAGSIVVAKVG